MNQNTIETLRQALEALGRAKNRIQGLSSAALGTPDGATYVDEASANLRTLIEQMEKAEPVAFEWVHPEKGLQISHLEPADYEEVYELRPLYTHPAPSTPDDRKDAERWKLVKDLAYSSFEPAGVCVGLMLPIPASITANCASTFEVFERAIDAAIAAQKKGE